MTLRSRLIPSRCTSPMVPAKKNGQTDSEPCLAVASWNRSTMRSSASSQVMRLN